MTTYGGKSIAPKPTGLPSEGGKVQQNNLGKLLTDALDKLACAYDKAIDRQTEAIEDAIGTGGG